MCTQWEKANTVSRTEYTRDQSAASALYIPQRPCFDRISSCRRNYSLNDNDDFMKSTHAESFTDPKSRQKVDQPRVGGYTKKDGLYFSDEKAKDSIRRGGGGGLGCLGLDFNIINGAPHNLRQASRYGPKKSLNFNARTLYDSPHHIINGRQLTVYTKPIQPTPDSLRRPDSIHLRTRPW